MVAGPRMKCQVRGTVVTSRPINRYGERYCLKSSRLNLQVSKTGCRTCCRVSRWYREVQWTKAVGAAVLAATRNQCGRRVERMGMFNQSMAVNRKDSFIHYRCD